MKKYFCFAICLVTINIALAGKLTTIDHHGVTFYSEYYSGPTSKLNGTIVFINGSGSDINDWDKKLLHCAKQLAPVFLYDRSGVGKSPPNADLSYKNPLTAKLASDQLMMLLKARHIKPPYLIVAHSFGAIFAGYFTLTNPGVVKGLLLVDPAPRDFDYASSGMKKFAEKLEEIKLSSSLDIYKKYGGPETEIIYLLAGFNESKHSLANLGGISNAIPVTVMSSTEMEKLHPLIQDWYSSQKQWLNENPMSKIISVNAGHFIQLEQPEKICDELVEMVGGLSK